MRGVSRASVRVLLTESSCAGCSPDRPLSFGRSGGAPRCARWLLLGCASCAPSSDRTTPTEGTRKRRCMAGRIQNLWRVTRSSGIGNALHQSRRHTRPQGQLDLLPQPILHAGRVDPKWRFDALEFESLLLSIVVPVNSDSVFYGFSLGQDDHKSIVPGFLSQSIKDGACDSTERELWGK